MALMFEGVTSAFGPTAGPALNEWLVNFTLAQHELLGWCSQYALVRLCVCVCVCLCVCVCVCAPVCTLAFEIVCFHLKNVGFVSCFATTSSRAMEQIRSAAC